uniref:Uncharacterized protein n=1 Tax=Haemonchus contortus TaxID=6289 RepID=W6NI08_HAECO
MTFAVETMDSRRRYATMNGTKQNPPPPSSTQYRQPLGPKNSLDYWQKAKDQQGVTYYWNPSANPFYGMDTIYAQQKPRTPQRPAPFPLSIPPPQPAQIKPRNVPTTISSSIPIYHNVPTTSPVTTTTAAPMTVASQALLRLKEDPGRPIGVGIANGHLNQQRTEVGYGPKRAQPLIWSVQTDPLRELRPTATRSYPSVSPACGGCSQFYIFAWVVDFITQIGVFCVFRLVLSVSSCSDGVQLSMNSYLHLDFEKC